MLQALTQGFYRERYWIPLRLEEIESSEVSHTLMSCAVLSSKRIGAKLAQAAVQVAVDGLVGPQTIRAINAITPRHFDVEFCVSRIQRYREVCLRKPSQREYFFGWVARALRGLERRQAGGGHGP